MYHDLAGCGAGAKVLQQYNIAQLLPLRERPSSVPSGSEPNSIVAREGVVGSTVDYCIYTCTGTSFTSF